MAIRQTASERTIATSVTDIKVGQGLNQLAEATSAVNKLLVDKTTDIAINQAASQGQQDALNEQAPENLAAPLTKATKAYNNAVIDTETRHLNNTAQNLINEAITQYTNPATFTRETPAQFDAALNGIAEGIIDSARDENRSAVKESVGQMSGQASLQMLKYSLEYDNKKMHESFNNDISLQLKQRRNAVIDGNIQKAEQIDKTINDIIDDYSTMNSEISQSAPKIRESVEHQSQVDNILYDYKKAQSENKTTEYMASLASNEKNIPYDIWKDGVDNVIKLEQLDKRLNNDINAEQIAVVNRGIETGEITSAEDLINYSALTVPQILAAMTKLEKTQQKNLENNNDVITAQRNILTNRAGANSSTVKNQMFEAALSQMESELGRPATLFEQSQSILGLNNYPASGMPGTPMGDSVPAFDATVANNLLSKDVALTAQAALVYNDMVNIRENPNSLNLSGEALSVATTFTSLNKGGIPVDQAAELATNTVLNAKEPQMQTRTERFKREYEYVNPLDGSNRFDKIFKEVTGVKNQAFKTDEAYNIAKTSFMNHYLDSNSEQAAIAATKYDMRMWGTSKYFDNGYVGQPVPENELPIANIGNSLDNMLVSNLQHFINRNQQARDANPDLDLPIIEWADKNQTITGTETEQQRVFDKLLKSNRPRIKVNGLETDVVLIPDAGSRLNDKISYVLGVYDKFNNLHPLQDPTNTINGIARFSPQSIQEWAPSVATQQVDDAFRKTALDIRRTEVESKTTFTPEEHIIMQNSGPFADVVFNNMMRAKIEDPEKLQEIVEDLKRRDSGASSAAVREKVAEADIVGIEPDVSLETDTNAQVDSEKKKNKNEILTKEDNDAKKQLSKKQNEKTNNPSISDNYYDVIAKVESGDKGMKAVSHTGAIGKYQFLKSTWSDLVDRYGKKYNITNKDIYNLEAQEMFIKPFTEQNKNILKKGLKREPTLSELYIAHNLGAGGALKLIRNKEKNPNITLSKAIIGSDPKNNPRFLMSKGKPVSAGEAYNRYSKLFEN